MRALKVLYGSSVMSRFIGHPYTRIAQKRRYEATPPRHHGYTAPPSQSMARVNPAPVMRSVTLSAIRGNNLSFLRKELGDALLEKRTGMPLNRLKELCDGRDFDDAVAFHLESELGLPAGFFDRLNPQLSPQTLERLKSLQEEAQEEQSGADLVAPGLKNEEVPHDTSGEKEKSRPILHLTAKSNPDKIRMVENMIEGIEMNAASFEQPPVKKLGRPAKAPRENIDLSGVPLVEQNRLNNFRMLLSAHGAKSRMAELMNCSPSAISLILTPKPGRSVFSDKYAKQVTSALQLPEGWLDEPHELTEVPEYALQLLRGEVKKTAPAASNLSASATQVAPTAAVSLAPVRETSAPTVEYRRKRRLEAESVATAPTQMPATDTHVGHSDVPQQAASITREQEDTIRLHLPSVVEPPVLDSAQMPHESAVEPKQTTVAAAAAQSPAEPTPSPAEVSPPAALATPQPLPEMPALSTFSQMPKELLEPFNPETLKVPAMAEALLRIIAVKAQQGKLSDKVLSDLLLRVALA